MKKIAIIIIAFIFASLTITSCQKAKEPERRKEKPYLLWEKDFAEGILEFDLAEDTGNVLIHTGIYKKGKIMYFDSQGTLLWDKTDEKLSFGGIDVSENGEYILYQTAPLVGKATDYFQSDVHFLNRKGEELWRKPNPYGNKHAELSPTGRYIVFFGADFDETHFFDNKLTHIWGKKVDSWFIKFDPTEEYLVEGMDGVIYNIKGEEVWKFGGGQNYYQFL